MQSINPTRMNLINLRRRAAMANKGYGILKRKREVLVMEFLKMLKMSKNDINYLNAIMERAYKGVAIASAYVGNFELEEVAMHVEEAEPIKITVKNIMGVKVPEISGSGKQTAIDYNIISTDVAADDISSDFSNAINVMIDVAQREQGLKRLVIEIDKTKRRVNALQYVVIPNIRSRSKYIAVRLEEIDRDMFAALKHVKKRLAKEQHAT
ncbi:MAG: V-type ATP synthase subunit D [Candidatus Micrarchaeaceae archaeon]